MSVVGASRGESGSSSVGYFVRLFSSHFVTQRMSVSG